MAKVKELSVFLPAYNEENNLSDTVSEAVSVLKKLTEKYELIIVNDGSKDKTEEVAKKLAEKNRFIRIIEHPVNRGYGAALKSGLYGAKYKWIVFTDADGQFNFSELERFIETQRSTKSDLVIGYYLGRKVPFYRIWGSKLLWEPAVFLLFRLKVKDIDCGFKLISRKVIETISPLEAERGPFISSELLIKAKKAGFKISQIGVRHYPRRSGKATGADLKVILGGFSDLFRLYWKLR